MCVNFIHKRRDLQYKVACERQIFLKNFSGQFNYSQSFCQKSTERKSPKNTFCILFWCLYWGSNPGFTSNKPTYYLLNYSDFTIPSRVSFSIDFCLMLNDYVTVLPNDFLNILLESKKNKSDVYVNIMLNRAISLVHTSIKILSILYCHRPRILEHIKQLQKICRNMINIILLYVYICESIIEHNCKYSRTSIIGISIIWIFYTLKHSNSILERNSISICFFKLKFL